MEQKKMREEWPREEKREEGNGKGIWVRRERKE